MNFNFPKLTGERTRLACGQRRLVVGTEDSSTRGASNHSRGGCAPHFQPSRRGVALIITVILLAALTLMTLAFLALSRRERGAVTTTTDTASARLAADAALASAEAQIMANVLSTTNPYNFGLIVSTNYLPLTTGDPLRDLTNLFVSPRTPVYLSNLVTHAMENRFYLDLNRNGYFDTNGLVTDASGSSVEVGDPEWIGLLQRPDQPYGPNNPFVARFAFIALPIGNSLDLNAIHNEAVTKQVRPNPTDIVVNDGFLRNEGVGSWEINLAAFLADLNTDEWGQIIGSATWYQYNDLGPFNKGHAFEDALSLLSYRYGYNYNLLATADQLFTNAANVFPYDNIDGYSDGPLMTGFQLPGDTDDPSLHWSGADNTNHYFNLPSELFNTNIISPSFYTNLWNAGTSNATYDRYTFYRLLSQLGTDSTPESGKMNLNYSNAVAYFDANGIATNITIIPGAETNFTQWTPSNFFTIAADRMLRTYSQEWLVENPQNFTNTFGTIITNAFGITNIPVWVDGRFVYTPAVQRVLQLAANIYDATTNSFYPSVFRPIFEHDNLGNVFITGYTNLITVNVAGDPQLALPYDIVSITNLSPKYTPITDASGNIVNVYGVPWIIGAKKGFPNFNEFAMDSSFRLTRKLEVTRQSTNVPVLPPPSFFNYYEMFNLSLTNQLGVECWNSYTNNFTDPVAIYVTCTNTYLLTNDEGFSANAGFFISGFTNFSVWTNYNPNVYPLLAPASFQIPLNTNLTIVPDSTYRFTGGPGPYLAIPPQLDYETDVPNLPQPHWWLITSNDVRVIILDTTPDTTPLPGRPYPVIDYVQLSGPNSVRDLTAEILSGYDTVGSGSDTGYNNLWDTNVINGWPAGLNDQLNVSQGLGIPTYDATQWSQDEKSAYDQMNGLLVFLNGANTTLLAPTDLPGYTPDPTTMGIAAMTNQMQVPYTPTATVVQRITWQANDPLVHYIASDLLGAPGNGLYLKPNWPENLGQLNDRYMPWGGNAKEPSADIQDDYNLALKDPLVWQSDDWDFPTYKFPTVGWLGRVHRGTPWQTVYLKSANILNQTNTSGVVIGANTWMTWTGNGNSYDAVNTAPAQDRLLFNLFTTAFDDNATRGTLSVNVGAGNPSSQAGLAAWSALFSGVIVLSNNAVDSFIQFNQHNGSLTNFWPFPVNPAGPAGVNYGLGSLVTNINGTRATFTNVDGLVGSFEHIGDVLATPALTVQSPFLSWSDPIQQTNGISDEMYEWLPQQTMSLLRVGGSPQTPMRYVIYSYGQALKPAQNSLVTSGNFFGMCTNYQIVSEAATRAVVRFNSALTNNVNFTTFPPTMTSQVTNNNAVIERFNVLPPD